MAISPILEIINIKKTFVNNLFQNHIALSNVNFTVSEGETFGFLGCNGAGKTTLLKIILGFLRPDEGSVKIFNTEITSIETKKHVGFLPENPYFYKHLTGRELLFFVGNLFNLNKKTILQRSEELLSKVGLTKFADVSLGKYSKGMLTRIGLAQALINDPKLILLDEPMSGLDPLGRKMVQEIMRDLKKQGKTLFFSSHILSDVENICDRVGILHKGKLITTGSLSELLKQGETLENFFISTIQEA